MKNKGFTLVELLAVIVILAIISMIAVVSITSLAKRSRDGEYVNEINILVSSATSMYKNERTRGNTDVFIQDSGGYKIFMKNIKGSIPTTDSYGYKYNLESNYVYFKEDCDNAGLCRVKTNVHMKSCKTDNSTCHCIYKNDVSSDGNEITSSDIKDKANCD